MEWLIVLGLVGLLGGYAWEKSRSAPSSGPHGVTPPPPPAPGLPALPVVPGFPVPVPSVSPAVMFPIPDPDKFGVQVIAAEGGSVEVASFLPATRAAMVQALSAREWRVTQTLATGSAQTLLLVGPPDAGNAVNVDVLSAIRIGLMAGMNIFMDADAALKLEGSANAPDPAVSGNIVALAKGLAMPDEVSFGEEVAMTPKAAEEALDLNFPNSRFVLFAQGGETI